MCSTSPCFEVHGDCLNEIIVRISTVKWVQRTLESLIPH